MKKKRPNIKDLINYVKKPLDPKEIRNIYIAEDIIIEKCDLYFDFIKTLCGYVHDTYLGSDHLKTDEDVKGHIKWCFNKTRREFFDYGFHFTFDETLYDYFKELLIVCFYSPEQEDKFKSLKSEIEYWKDVLDFSGLKTESSMEDLVYLYHLFDDSLNPERKTYSIDSKIDVLKI